MTKSPKQIVTNLLNSGVGKLPTSKGLVRIMKKQWFMFFLKHYCQHVHAPSHFYVDFYQKNYGIPPEQISRLPFGLNFENLNPSKTRETVRKEFTIDNEFVIVCVSTFRRLKRIDRLITAFSFYLDNSNNKNNTKLLIVGDGIERQSLEKLVDKLKITSNVIFTGFRQDIPNVLNAADLFILPSEFENFPVSIIEAMFFKLPVIVFQNSGGAEELVRETGGGIVVQNEDVLSDKLHAIIQNYPNFKQIGINGHNFVFNHFSREKYVNCLLKSVHGINSLS